VINCNVYICLIIAPPDDVSSSMSSAYTFYVIISCNRREHRPPPPTAGLCFLGSLSNLRCWSHVRMCACSHVTTRHKRFSRACANVLKLNTTRENTFTFSFYFFLVCRAAPRGGISVRFREKCFILLHYHQRRTFSPLSLCLLRASVVMVVMMVMIFVLLIHRANARTHKHSPYAAACSAILSSFLSLL